MSVQPTNSLYPTLYPQLPTARPHPQLPTASAQSSNVPQARSEEDRKSRVASIATLVYPSLPPKLPTANAQSSHVFQGHGEADRKSSAMSTRTINSAASANRPSASDLKVQAAQKGLTGLKNAENKKGFGNCMPRSTWCGLTSNAPMDPSPTAIRPLTAATATSSTATVPIQLTDIPIFLTDTPILFRGIPILSSLLDDLFKQVSALIQQAEIACNELMIQAGRVIALEIENIKTAYIESLDYTVDKLDALLKNHLERIQNMIENLELVTEDVLKEFKRATTQFILALPFSSKHTQLTSVSPYYVVYSNKEPKVTFEGVFDYAATPGFEATLTFGETPCKPPVNSTQSLSFNVPLSAIVPDKDRALVESSSVTGILSAPWDNGSWWWFLAWWWWSKKVDAIFRVNVVVLPPSPGKIDFEFTAKKTEIVKKPFTTETISIPLLELDKEHRIQIDRKWKIEQGSPKVVLLEGNPKFQRLSISRIEQDNTIVINVIQAIQMKFCVTLNRFEEAPGNQKPRIQPISLEWGSSKTVERIKGEEIRVMFDAFDGTHNEFVEPFKYNRYLQLSSTATNYTILATMPK